MALSPFCSMTGYSRLNLGRQMHEQTTAAGHQD